MKESAVINIIGAGLSGLSAARTFAEGGRCVRLISVQPSERAQSNLAEGGINGALDLMGENDSTEEHFADTMAGGVYLADPEMVRGLTEAAPEIIYDCERLGVPFHREDGHIVERNFGGQKKKRTAYAMSSTGKVLTVALIDRVRRFEAAGLVERYSHHCFERLLTGKRDGGKTVCLGVQVRDIHTRKSMVFDGPVLMACGGMNGLFTGVTTGTTANTGTAAAQLFISGVRMANLEFLQYHPTTVAITGKRLLISEAARGEGGRLFFEDADGRHYFMEEKYGPGGNLMPRDVVSREIARSGKQVYLDLTGLSDSIWKNRLSDLREEIIHYMNLDPAVTPVPVSPGIHYFMGGILTDRMHRTNVAALYASGECACAYHGANRLGGNSLLGAIYGGKTAARAMMEDGDCRDRQACCPGKSGAAGETEAAGGTGAFTGAEPVPYVFMSDKQEKEIAFETRLEEILIKSLGILRDEDGLTAGLEELRELKRELVSERKEASRENRMPGTEGRRPEDGEARGAETPASDELNARLALAEAILRAALERRESRGAHTRDDYPDTDEAYRKTTAVDWNEGAVRVSFIPV